ncbi:RtcB family protein [Desulfobacterales bacterium HSG16]|nr:RtcB family protein [Desulfobacterales bacterium HSG16]
MNLKQLAKLGLQKGKQMDAAISALSSASRTGMQKRKMKRVIKSIINNPQLFLDDPVFGQLAALCGESMKKPENHVLRESPAPYEKWGTDIDEGALSQMKNACSLPISIQGALMPDAHLGYGLPIGGVLAAENAVIPFAVGMDIACRMKLSVFDMPVSHIRDEKQRLIKAVESETRFGVGVKFKNRRQHPVMDEDWSVSPVTKALKDKAWGQLGTSGSGNHFVEFGKLELYEKELGLEPGIYPALLSHSGSRGTGAEVAGHYSRLAKKIHPDLPKELASLAWLELNTEEGQEYWAAMELMGRYAAASHELIHKYIAAHLGLEITAQLENHHNFAWKEKHMGMDLVVHRKGATPAGPDAMGIIPGSMATPGYVIRGKGNAASLHSASHGAGRLMSRKASKKRFKWKDAEKLLSDQKITLLSAGLDEVPMAYKDIDAVMDAQKDLVHVLARFDPRIVKMAPSGQRPKFDR